ncbi:MULTISPECIES: hypothetical protein [Carnobacterium]|uniref:hypothetical protein n=1 Tax=Carnobacterium TaxID=2747 RepID=UPI000D4BFFDA|nr:MULTISPECIES: hypothetical protein [Carnobacterium]MCO6019393.1 hypothetical protein [Carnobacterium divergens]MDT1940889.1 hypothetical protein [Carnobacterium divergens]MDT1943328.1 hypothetical protein [Carnobacterium divergens]MDT1947974.1 hypothetical protein [Carnobacterium divergens]MDT1951658.1 hypothetical protein [Carnobacterium divergens]
MTTYLYIIKLKKNRYYIGSTIHKKRIKDQVNQKKRASQWVKINTVEYLCGFWDIGLLEYREAEILETIISLEIMKKVGLCNVRGGFFTLTNTDGFLQTISSHYTINRFGLKNIESLNLNFLKSDLVFSDYKMTRLVEDCLAENGYLSRFMGNSVGF